MIRLLRRTLDQVRGTGEASVTIPSMDGAFRPNRLLDQAEVIAEVKEPDNLVDDGTRILLTSGSALLSIGRGDSLVTPEAVHRFDAPISCVAGHASGLLAIGLNDGRIVLHGGHHDGKVLSKLGDRALFCPTALVFVDPQTLLIALGSRTNTPQSWKRDLMEKNATGSVWRLNLESGEATCLADNMAFPYGLAPLASDSVVVSEAWRHRLVLVNGKTKPQVMLGDLPGYPARISSDGNGGHWLSIFAPRRQMVEFVLREPAYLKRMLTEVPEELWMAPALSSGHSFEEPLQGGAVKHLGIDKPWAPTRSYGMLVGLNHDFSPLRSAHSRADGKRHGITSALGLGVKVLAASKGSGKILALDVNAFDGV
jgi:hypothetical protein